MTNVLADILIVGSLVAASYLLGAIPVGLLIGRVRGIDIRQTGSGNTGATNVMRSLGWKASAIVLVLDIAKAVLPVLVALLVRAGPSVAAASGLAAVMGHNWPIYIGWKGGKGVSSSLGVMMLLMPIPTLLGGLLAIGLIARSKYVSLGSVAGACITPLLVVAWGFAVEALPPAYIALSFILSVLIIVRHRANIGRLVAGNEHKLGEKAV